jgi:hypothetical protein
MPKIRQWLGKKRFAINKLRTALRVPAGILPGDS